MFYEMRYTVDSRDVDCFGHCRASALLGCLQEAAGQAAARFGAANYQMVEKYRCFWMVARMHFVLETPLVMGDELTLKTWHRGGDKLLSYREFDLGVNGVKAGEALSTWVLADMEGRTLRRMADFAEMQGTDGGSLIRDTRIPRLRTPQALPVLEERRLRYSETDPNGHVNNSRYADYLCDALRLETASRDTFVRELQLSYLKECRAGELLTLRGALTGDEGVVEGVDAAGEPRFLGAVTLGRRPVHFAP